MDFKNIGGPVLNFGCVYSCVDTCCVDSQNLMIQTYLLTSGPQKIQIIGGAIGNNPQKYWGPVPTALLSIEGVVEASQNWVHEIVIVIMLLIFLLLESLSDPFKERRGSVLFSAPCEQRLGLVLFSAPCEERKGSVLFSVDCSLGRP